MDATFDDAIFALQVAQLSKLGIFCGLVWWGGGGLDWRMDGFKDGMCVLSCFLVCVCVATVLQTVIF